MELAGAAKLQLAVLAIAFFISRVVHAYGMLYTKTASVGAVGMMIQHAVLLSRAFGCFIPALFRYLLNSNVGYKYLGHKRIYLIFRDKFTLKKLANYSTQIS